eukprot:9439574-Pyramimonas_sp.AAC.1
MTAQDVPAWRLVPDLPREFPQRAPVGCARFPLDWSHVQVAEARDAQDLAVAWDQLVQGVEVELTNRFDLAGPPALAYQGRGGAPRSVWRQLKWRPPMKRTYARPETLAWKTALRW